MPVLAVGITSKEARRGAAEFRAAAQAVKNEAKGAAQGVRQIGKESQIGFKQATRSIGGFQRALVSLGAAIGAFTVARISDQMKLMEARLKLVTDTSSDLARVQERLFQIARESRLGFADLGDTYARFARATRDLNISQERTLALTETVSKAILVSGATAAEASAGLIQFSQGLASGELRGEEFRSVTEQLPRLARALADGLGLSIGELRKLAFEGKLTTDVVLKAVEASAAGIEGEFRQMPLTIGQATTLMGNSLSQLIKKLEESTGAGNAVAKAIRAISEAVDQFSKTVAPDLNQQLIEAQRELKQLQERQSAVGQQITEEMRRQFPQLPPKEVSEKAQSALRARLEAEIRLLVGRIEMESHLADLQTVNANAERSRAKDARDRAAKAKADAEENLEVQKALAKVAGESAQRVRDHMESLDHLAIEAANAAIEAKRVTMEWGAGAKQAFEDYAETAAQSGKLAQNAITSGLDGMADALADFVRTGKLEWKSLIDDMIRGLIRLFIQSQILGPISGFFGSLFGPTTTPAGPPGGVNASGGPGISGQTGLSFRTPSVPGEMVPLLRLHGGEHVEVTPAHRRGGGGGGGGAGNVSVIVNNNGAPVQAQVEARRNNFGDLELVATLDEINERLINSPGSKTGRALQTYTGRGPTLTTG